MENYVVSALKYRPTSFETVVGQESITTTLQNAIANDELAKAYLFCGPRGVGKTTCARIFAKAINEGVAGVDADYSYNLFELDAASNNSVDDIRQIIDQVRVPPQIGKYKVYIIDEVHMLSKAAFNAFLKTLEEPPAHAIFVLATTEKHKVLPTILSRCQIYDFKRITVGDTVAHLEKVAKSEGISYEKEALQIIAQKADGALRDALSVFDQMVSFTGKNLSREAVAESLNVLDYDYFFRAAENFTHGDVTGSLLLFDEVIGNGFDPLHYLNGLNEHFRNLLVVKDVNTARLLDQTEKIRTQYIQQSMEFSMAQLLEFLEEGQKTALNYRTSNYKRLLVEILLLKYCSHGQALSDEKKKSDSRRYTKGLKPQKPELKVPETPPVAPPEYPKIIIQSGAEETQTKPEESVAKQAMEVAAKTEIPASETPNPLPTRTANPIEEQKVAESSPKVTEKIEIAAEKSEVNAPTPVAAEPIVVERQEGPINISKKKKLSRSSISLTDMDDEEQEVVTEVEEEKKKEDFTQADLEKYWAEYAVVVKERGQMGFASSLTNNIPIIKDGHILEITLENYVQVENINEERANLHDFLRTKLNNDLLSIHTIVNEDDAPVEQLRPEDKLRAMMTKNENLKDLFEDLDLDLER
ncbi:MAG: DNA polymerase-3 subunit gamma/tau [Patiriisocius sp.]|jgi:DNA polymerase-3 subunit gamma/tau